MKFIRRKESRCCNNIIINLNHRATIYFPLISKIVHRTVTVHDRSSRPRIRVNVYVSREENNKAFSSSYLSPRISSRNCKGPSEWRPGLGWPDEWSSGRKIEIRKKNTVGGKGEMIKGDERKEDRFWTQASWPTVGRGSILFLRRDSRKLLLNWRATGKHPNR